MSPYSRYWSKQRKRAFINDERNVRIVREPSDRYVILGGLYGRVMSIQNVPPPLPRDVIPRELILTILFAGRNNFRDILGNLPPRPRTHTLLHRNVRCLLPRATEFDQSPSRRSVAVGYLNDLDNHLHEAEAQTPELARLQRIPGYRPSADPVVDIAVWYLYPRERPWTKLRYNLKRRELERIRRENHSLSTTRYNRGALLLLGDVSRKHFHRDLWNLRIPESVLGIFTQLEWFLLHPHMVVRDIPPFDKTTQTLEEYLTSLRIPGPVGDTDRRDDDPSSDEQEEEPTQLRRSARLKAAGRSRSSGVRGGTRVRA